MTGNSMKAIWMAVLVGVAGLLQTAEAQYFSFGKNRVHYANLDWNYLQSEHFDVYYYEPGGAYLAAFTARAAEDAYDQIAQDFQHEISDRIAILVYQSHNEFAVNTAAPLPDFSDGIGGVTELFKNRVIIPFTGDYADYRRLVHHELVHAVINDMFYGGSIQNIIQNNIQLAIPLWFNEGLAEYQAQGWDTQSDMYVREAIINDNLAPINYLSGFFAYRGGQSVWDYISEQYGREKIGEILNRLRLTRSVGSAFRSAVGLSIEELSEKWQSNLKKVYWPEIATREDLNDIGKALITREKGYLYNTSPAISPQGDQMAFITTKDGLFDLYLARTNDGRIIRKLVNGQDNTGFESFKLLSPGITWNPEGTHIALAVKSGASDAIAVVDVKTKNTKHYRIDGLDAIISTSWSPDGKTIAFSASRDAQSDLYVLDLESGEAENLTNDIFSDHEPSWSPDGKFLVFHSDRAGITDLGRYTTENFDMIEYDYGQFDLYKLTPGDTEVVRLTEDEMWDETSGKFGDDPNTILFISDRNGIQNLYAKDLTTLEERPLTDVITGITQVSLSRDGKKAIVNSLFEGTPSLFLLKTPFERLENRQELVPNVWAQRVMQTVDPQTPALALATDELIQQNPFLRDAVDGIPFPNKMGRPGNIYVRPEALAAMNTTNPRVPVGVNGENALNAANGAGSLETGISAQDTTAYGGVRVDFRNYIFGEAFDEANDDRLPEDLDRFAPVDNVDDEGRFRRRKYKLKFSADLINGTAGFNTLYGTQGITQFIFSDMLGNHQIFLATNLLIDLRNSDYLFGYAYLPKRTDFTFSGFHTARIIGGYNNLGSLSYFRFRYFGGSANASYPLDKFRRFDFDLSMLNVRQTDIYNISAPTESRSFFMPSITYTKDVTTPGFISPSSGYRLGVRLSGSPGGINKDQVQFATVLGDIRWYRSFGRYYTLAVRGSGAASVGPSRQLFYASGVQSWLNRKFDPDNGFPITDVSDFILATPVLPMRGYDINAQNGSYFGLVNAEFRFPLVAALLPGPIPIIPLYNLQGVAFVDAGSIWGGRNTTNPRFDLTTTNANGERILDDLKVGAGFGLRTIVIGYPVRIDFAWPHDGQGFGERRTFFSIGLDF